MNQTTETRRRLNATVIKCADLKTGDEVQGTYLEASERPWLDKESGEEKMIPTFSFENEAKERTILFGDAGLKNAMLNAGVTKGDRIVVQKRDKVDLGGGRRVNAYDIYAL